jgi:ATP-binding cassette, subfamily B, bacterial PglK
VSVLRKTLDLLTPSERRHTMLLIPLSVMMALAEVAGIASITPFLALLADPEVAHRNPFLSQIYVGLGFESDRAFLTGMGVAVIVILVLTNAMMAGGLWVLTRFGTMRNHTISRRLLVRYLKQPYPFFLRSNSAALANNVLQEVEQVVNAVILPGLQLLAKGTAVLAIILLLVVVDPLLAALMGTLLGGTYLLLSTSTRKYLGRIGRERVVANQARHQAVHESMGAIKELKLLGREPELVRRYDGPSRAFAHYQAGSRLLATLPRYALESIAFGSLVLVVLLLMRDDRSMDQIVPLLGLYAFAGYRLMPALQQVFHSATLVRYGSGALEEVHAAFAPSDQGPVAAESFTRQARSSTTAFVQHVRFEKVGFTYGVGDYVLHDLEFEIPARSSVAFVGGTGAGKTTIIDLLVGLLEPSVGRITIDGVTLDASTRDDWQARLGYVPQAIYLTDDTIARNIALGLPDEAIDMMAVRRAAKLAHIDAFIEEELPNGYATLVGERGVRLSGGQRQRIGIARALYHDPEVLVLDEATSALDGATERVVFDAIRELYGKVTTIIIAHRLSTVQACDHVFVLDRGRLVASGTFDEVLAESPQLRDMARGSAAGGHPLDGASVPKP